MATQTPISGLGSEASAASGDLFAIVDIDDTSQAVTGSTKNITLANLIGSLGASPFPAVTFGAAVAMQGQVTFGNVGSGTGATVFFKDDSGNSRWAIGELGAAGAKDYQIFDNANSASRLTIDHTTGVITVPQGITANITGNCTGSSGSTAGNAATATKLQTARTIASAPFDGTSNINIDAGNLTGTTLSNTVVSSSLTSLGVIAALVATKAKSATGTVSAPSSSATTIFTPSVAGTYVIGVYLASGAGGLSATAFAVYNGSNVQVLGGGGGGSMTISQNTGAVQVTQTSGSTQTITWTYLLIA